MEGVPCPTNKGVSYTNLVSSLAVTLKLDYYYYYNAPSLWILCHCRKFCVLSLWLPCCYLEFCANYNMNSGLICLSIILLIPSQILSRHLEIIYLEFLFLEFCILKLVCLCHSISSLLEICSTECRSFFPPFVLCFYSVLLPWYALHVMVLPCHVDFMLIGSVVALIPY